MNQLRKKRLSLRLRPDGRPEAFDIAPSASGKCRRCLERLGGAQVLRRGDLFLMSGENSPWADNISSLICRSHLPANVVISDPFRGFECRNLQGTEFWQESDPNAYATDDDPSPGEVVAASLAEEPPDG